MTLRELMAAHPERFYAQTWYAGHAFLDRQDGGAPAMPTGFLTTYSDAARAAFLPFAVTLAMLYVEWPGHPLWRKRIWTADLDDHGQRIYVTDNGNGLEIHRFLHVTEEWGVLCWS